METGDPAGRRGTGLAHWSFRAPLLVAAALICLISGLNMGRHLQARAPRDSWEAIEVMEAWRSFLGLPVYDLSPNGHATHFYGALMPWVQGEIFRWAGPNNVSGRVLTLVSAMATIALIVAATRVKGSAWLLVVVCAALLGLNHRSGQYLVANRPDMTAFFFTMAALLLMGLGMEKRRGGLVAAGAACLVVGFFFKQTAAAFAVVPTIALALRGRRPTRTEVLWALFPLAAVVGTILYLRAFCPVVYHYMIQVPGSYRIGWLRVLDGLVLRILLASPLFLIVVGERLMANHGSSGEDPRMPWVVAVLAVAIPSSAVAFGKFGGAANCLLPAQMGMIAFCALRLPTALHRLEGRVGSPIARTLLGSFAAALLFFSAFPRLQVMADLPPWNTGYDEVVASVSRLPGTVICLEDPTIPMQAKARAGRSLAAEMDSHAVNGRWPDAMPETVVDEVRRADFLVDIRYNWDDRLSERDLRSMGLEPADDLMPNVSSYRLWRHAAAPGARGTERTAWHGAVVPSPHRALGE